MGSLSDKLEYLLDTKEQLKQALVDKSVDIDDNTTFRNFAVKTTEDTGLVGTSDANATANDMLLDKTAYVNGQKITGTIYTAKSIKRSASSVVKDNSLLDVTGSLGNSSFYLPIQSSITVSAPYSSIANAINLNANQIKQGETVLDVEGSVVELVGQTKTVTPTTSQQVITPDQGFNGLTSVTIEAAPEDLTEQITAQEQIIAQLQEEVKNKAMGDAKLQSKEININQNGTIIVTPDVGYDGLSDVSINVDETNIPDWSEIGYNDLPSDFLIDIAYAKNIYDNWDNTETDLTSKFTDSNSYQVYHLRFMPLVDTSNATNMRNMFYNCYGLVYLPLLDTSNVIDMVNMFSYCKSLRVVPQFDTSNVKYMDGMFSSCQSLQTAPQFDTSNVESMANMFKNCVNLENIPIYDVSKVLNFYNFVYIQRNPKLSNESLNNILYMCANATAYINQGTNMTLQTLGLSRAQTEICKTLSNWDAFVTAGWTTGYDE